MTLGKRPARPGAQPSRTAIRAVLLDALGTLVRLDEPGPRLRAALERESGVDVGVDAAERAFGAEVAYYLANQMRGADHAGLEALRDECAAVTHEALGAAGERTERAAVRQALLDALVFVPFPDVVPALRALRERGLTLVVASNWDCSLPEWLDRAGLGDLLDGAVSSAVVGAPKPAPAVFDAALALAGVGAAEAIHVGDTLAGDVAGARAAGIRAVLVLRAGDPPPGVETVRSLEALPSLL
jgi:putative hydrolase of the HAD superfamily